MNGNLYQLIENRHDMPLPCGRQERTANAESIRYTGEDRMTKEDASVPLFSYGTLRQANVQMASFGRLLAGSPDSLPGYSSVMIEITDPDVIAASGSKFHPMVIETGNAADEVPGILFSVTEADLAAADAYEVADYKRIRVVLKSGKDAWVYVKAKP